MSSSEDLIKVLGQVVGKLAVSTNIADNGGLKFCFHGYQTYVTKQATHPRNVNQYCVTSVTRDYAEREIPAGVARRFYLSLTPRVSTKR